MMSTSADSTFADKWAESWKIFRQGSCTARVAPLAVGEAVGAAPTPAREGPVAAWQALRETPPIAQELSLHKQREY
jgi:hypothetical protein